LQTITGVSPRDRSMWAIPLTSPKKSEKTMLISPLSDHLSWIKHRQRSLHRYWKSIGKWLEHQLTTSQT
jgi:hypothetical protein